ncbi:MAG: hypothetical protein ACREAX_03645 [Candidatus Nitrosotenuis sp.]
MQTSDKKEEKLNSEIERKIKLVESGKVKGKTYTPDEYIKHVKKILED